MISPVVESIIERIVYHKQKPYILRSRREIYKLGEKPNYVWHLLTMSGQMIAYRTNGGSAFHVEYRGEVTTCVFGSNTEKAFRNQGFGTLLLKEAIKELKTEGSFDRIYVSTLKKNKACQKMIEKADFKKVSSVSAVFNYTLEL